MPFLPDKFLAPGTDPVPLVMLRRLGGIILMIFFDGIKFRGLRAYLIYNFLNTHLWFVVMFWFD